MNKKPTLLLLFMLMISMGSLRAQNAGYISLGYNQGITNYENLDFIIGRYNETRSFLTEEMSEIHTPAGFTINYGMFFKKLLVEVGYTAQKKKTYAQGVDATGSEVRRDLRMRQNRMNINLGFRALTTSVATLTPGVGIDVGAYSLATRSAGVNDIKDEDWESPVRSFDPLGTVFLQILVGKSSSTGIKALITPYYSYGFQTIDLAPLNETINPGTAILDPSPLEHSSQFFGVKVQIALYGGSVE